MKLGGIIVVAALLFFGANAMCGVMGSLTSGVAQIHEAVGGVGNALRSAENKPYEAPKWAKKYDHITCRRFRKKLNKRDSIAAAKELLTILRVRDKGPVAAQVTPPSRSLSLDFRHAIGEVCSHVPAGWSMGRVAQQAYITHPDFRP